MFSSCFVSLESESDLLLLRISSHENIDSWASNLKDDETNSDDNDSSSRKNKKRNKRKERKKKSAGKQHRNSDL